MPVLQIHKINLGIMKVVLIVAVLFASPALAQGVLTGTVYEDGTKQSLAGAHVLLKGTTFGTIVQQEGNFTIASIPARSYEVEISFIGYDTRTIPVTIDEGSTTNMSVNLVPGDLLLADVVVSAASDRPLNTLSPVDINVRPTNTAQDILRMVPGLFIAQHAGGGKAEQIFLRGFDIDHGTDINLEVDGLPVNMVSHAHGQGYSDLHFLIPELVQVVDFDKGPYFADKGDFTTAGYVDFQTRQSLEQNFVKAEAGQFGTVRTVAGVNLVPRSSKNTGYIATELFRSDGFFESPQDFDRTNVSGRFGANLGKSHHLSVGSSYFSSSWNASGQIPERAVRNGTITRFGSIDDTEGGQTKRLNLFLKHHYSTTRGASFDQQLYGIYYDFNLYSNFTFFLADPVNGDQIQQEESRMIFGYKANYKTNGRFANRALASHIGAGVRLDDVQDIALSNTVQREFLGDIQRGDINEGNMHIFVSETLALNERWSVNGAVRLDYFTFRYRDKLAADTRSEDASIVSPKLNITYEANQNTSFYARTGTGFHSNDARVVLGEEVRDILPRAYGIDVGAYIKKWDRLLLHAALWRLDLDQEFVYVGDAGVVEPSGETTRQGVDVSARYQILPWLFADIDLSFADPRAVGAGEDEAFIPLAPTFSSIGGLTVRNALGWNGSLRYRWLTDRAANEDNSLVANGFFLIDAVVNYRAPRFELGLSIENVFDSEWKEAQFDTTSRLADETEPVSEIHFTPGTPFFGRLKFTFFF